MHTASPSLRPSPASGTPSCRQQRHLQPKGRALACRAAAGEERCEPAAAASTEPPAVTPPAADARPAQQAQRRLRLPRPPNLGGKNPRVSYNATALAYMGDAVWELYARRKYFFPPTRMAAYYQSVVQNVRAERQAEHYAVLDKGGFLSKEEHSVLRWGRNATGSTSPKRFSQPDVSRETYRAATAVECLVGYLYLTDVERLEEVMEKLGMGLASSVDGSGEFAASSSTDGA